MSSGKEIFKGKEVVFSYSAIHDSKDIDNDNTYHTSYWLFADFTYYCDNFDNIEDRESEYSYWKIEDGSIWYRHDDSAGWGVWDKGENKLIVETLNVDRVIELFLGRE